MLPIRRRADESLLSPTLIRVCSHPGVYMHVHCVDDHELDWYRGFSGVMLEFSLRMASLRSYLARATGPYGCPNLCDGLAEYVIFDGDATILVLSDSD